MTSRIKMQSRIAPHQFPSDAASLHYRVQKFIVFNMCVCDVSNVRIRFPRRGRRTTTRRRYFLTPARSSSPCLTNEHVLQAYKVYLRTHRRTYVFFQDVTESFNIDDGSGFLFFFFVFIHVFYSPHSWLENAFLK